MNAEDWVDNKVTNTNEGARYCIFSSGNLFRVKFDKKNPPN